MGGVESYQHSQVYQFSSKCEIDKTFGKYQAEVRHLSHA